MPDSIQTPVQLTLVGYELKHIGTASSVEAPVTSELLITVPLLTKTTYQDVINYLYVSVYAMYPAPKIDKGLYLVAANRWVDSLVEKGVILEDIFPIPPTCSCHYSDLSIYFTITEIYQ